MNRPSGGIKLSSPGLSFHLFNLTQGWKTGSSIKLPKLCLPEGLVRLTVMSGTPDTLAVNAIVPFANAASGLPEGASVTDNVSTTSAYISFEVCRTFARRQGSAVPVVGVIEGVLELELDCNFLHLVSPLPCNYALQAQVTYPGRLMLPNSLSTQPSTSTTSLSAFGSVVLMFPASHISVRSCAIMS